MMKKLLLALLFAFIASATANAANCGVSGGNNCFWVSGGTGAWSSTSNWANTTGGASGFGPPTTGNFVVFDASSGSGTVTCDGGAASFGSLTTSLFTGTLCNSTDNFNPTLATNWVDAATSVHTVNLGVGTWTFSSPGPGGGGISITAGANLTLNANSSTIAFAPYTGQTGGINLGGGGHTFNIVTVGSANFTGQPLTISGNNTIATLNPVGPVVISLAAGSTQTLSGVQSWTGTAAAPFQIVGASGTISNIAFSSAGGTASWGIFNHINGTTNTLTATNSLSLGNVTGTISVTNPTGGGGGYIIGQ